MKRNLFHILTLAVGLIGSVFGEEDIFQFFEEEAEVVTAARRPTPVSQAPATTYVVQGDDIRGSGAQTLWDALRSVPGVDVMSTRAMSGEVSVRGLNRPLSNRTLILVDGRTVLQGFFDVVLWEEIPVTFDEIDRVEVVEGPASALYGPNAIAGVINIITKSPEAMEGTLASYARGNRSTNFGSVVHAGVFGGTGFKVAADWRKSDEFEQDRLASEVARGSALVSHRFASGDRIWASGGLNAIDTRVTTGTTGAARNEGHTSYLRADYEGRSIRVRGFWNRGRTDLREFNALSEPNLHYDTYEVSLDRAFKMGDRNRVVVGAGYRRNTIESRVFGPGLRTQNLWSLFFESEHQPSDRVRAVLSARLDRHPFTDLVLSPRGSIIFDHGPRSSFRVSGGTSFRNPTLLENYINLSQTLPNAGDIVPNPPFETIAFQVLGNEALDPERLLFVEAAHLGRVGSRLRTSLAMFHYRLRDLISGSTSSALGAAGPVTTTTFVNRGETRAWGFEAGVETVLTSSISGFANYAHLDFSGEIDPLAPREGGPAHKINAGVRVRHEGLEVHLTGHYVSETSWIASPPVAETVVYAPLPDYLLVNAGGTFAFSGRWTGLKATVSVSNLTNDEHYEIPGAINAMLPGLGGEKIGARYLARISYGF